VLSINKKGFDMMKIKIERKEKPNKPKKQKKTPTIKVGTHKKLTIALWVLLIGSVSFGMYKNFTAIDIHTVHEKEIIEQQIVDTNKVESFAESFVNEYFSWQQSQDSIDKRNERLKNYLTVELQQLNVDMIRSDIPTSSTVKNIQIWNVSQKDDNTFEVLFSVEQQITENETKKTVESTYSVTIYDDEFDNMIIIKNPTMSSRPQKSDHNPKAIESDGTVDAVTTEEINNFLRTFFKLYPTATESELAYYVSNKTLKPIGKDYVFVELVNPIYTMSENKVTVNVSVKYLDQETKATHISQFNLNLAKSTTWMIVQ